MGTSLDRSFSVPCSVRAQRFADVVLMTVDGELDVSTAPMLRAAVERIDPGRRILLDLGHVQFIDSSGLHALITVCSGTREVELARRSEVVDRLLDMTGTRSLVC